MIKVFWHQSDNFGDKLTPYFLDKLGIKYEYVDKGCGEEHYIICGSILSACNEHSIIWGAGLAQEYPFVKPKMICAVRGYLTKKMVLDVCYECPSVYGDISELLPLIYKPSIEKTRVVGFVPHYIEHKGEGCDLLQPVEDTINYILSCEKIITSSLHAFLTARAYGIEAEFYTSKNIIGQEIKIADAMSYKPNAELFLSVCPIEEIKQKLL